MKHKSKWSRGHWDNFIGPPVKQQTTIRKIYANVGESKLKRQISKMYIWRVLDRMVWCKNLNEGVCKNILNVGVGYINYIQKMGVVVKNTFKIQ